MKITTGTAHPTLAKEISEYLDLPLTDATVTAFPDGETFVKINENIRGEDFFIIQPTCPPSNHNLMELLIMVDAARRASAGRITAVIPLYGYARQDRKDQPRVPITAKLVANLLSAAGVDRVLTVDLHAAQIQGFFDIPVDHLHAKPAMVKKFKELLGGQMDNLVCVSPDVGGVKNARSMADSLGVDFAIVAKHRVSATKVEAKHVIGEVEGMNVLMIDDMTETAGTLCAAADILREHGAKRIFAGVSHAILGDLARQRFDASEIEKVIATNSVPQAYGEKVEVVSIAPLLAEGIKRISNSESVTSLFDI